MEIEILLIYFSIIVVLYSPSDQADSSLLLFSPGLSLCKYCSAETMMENWQVRSACMTLQVHILHYMDESIVTPDVTPTVGSNITGTP